jgi:rhomboid family GlyGly-CTERM serine protease
MITKADYAPRAVWLPPAVLVALILALQLGGEGVRSALLYQRELIGAGEWWRLLTANFVHLGWYHALLNVAGTALLVLLCPEPLSPAVWARRVVVIGLAMSLALYAFLPSLHWYVGFSGVLHGLFVLGLGRQAWLRDPVAIAALAFLLGKVAWEMVTGAPLSDEEAIGGRVLVESHLYGSLSALAYGLIFGAFTRTETFRRRRGKDQT